MRLGRFSSQVPGSQAGFAIIWALVVVAVIGVGLAAIGPTWANDAQRDRERDLYRVGAQYAQAIASYYIASPLNRREYPKNLESLVEDTRGGIVRRHLRRLYGDPMAVDRPWGLVRGADGGIRGVYSQSEDVPLHKAPVWIGDQQLPAAGQVKDWKFIAKVGA